MNPKLIVEPTDQGLQQIGWDLLVGLACIGIGSGVFGAYNKVFFKCTDPVALQLQRVKAYQ